MHADQHTLSDLIAIINDHRRSLEAAALGPGDPVRKAECERWSRAEAMTVAKITRNLARHGNSRAPLSSHELERYVDDLIDAYTDDVPDLRDLGSLTPKRQVRPSDGDP